MKLPEQIAQMKIIAIVRGVYGKDCLTLAEALYEGGIRFLEVAFEPGKLSGTQQAIRQLSVAMEGRVCIGAGTVSDMRTFALARQAGAKFIISPNFDRDVIRATKDADLVSIPGAMTPSEIFSAYETGADFVKVFPASVLGPAYIKAVLGPFPYIPLMAVGGVDENNMIDFLKAGVAGFGIGGNLVNKTWIREGDFDKITTLARTMCDRVR